MNHLRVPLMMLTSPAMMATVQAACWNRVLTISRSESEKKSEACPVMAAVIEVNEAVEGLMLFIVAI